VAIRVGNLDELVTREVLARIDELRGRAIWWGARARDPALAEAIERYRADLHQAAQDYYVGHLIDRAQFLDIRDKLNRGLAAERKDLLPLRVHRLLQRYRRSSPRAEWAKLSLEERRAVVAVVVDHVVVHPARCGGRFDPDRVEIAWVGEDGAPRFARRFPAPPKLRTSDGSFSAAGAARYLGIHPQSVYLRLHTGEIDATRDGSAWRITQAALDAFVDSCRHVTAPTEY
jgi:excisionase family DNA binding protein